MSPRVLETYYAPQNASIKFIHNTKTMYIPATSVLEIDNTPEN